MVKKIGFSLCLLLSFNVLANKTADELIKIIGDNTDIQSMHQQMVEMMVRSDPTLQPHQSIIQGWIKKTMTWENMRDDFKAIYAKYFTEEELTELLAFYKTDTGKKTLTAMPSLMREGGVVGMKLAKDHQEELIALLKEAEEAL